MKKAHFIAGILFVGLVGGVSLVRPSLIIPTAVGVAAVLTVELRPQ
jgi:hypothetical protein